jgi:hypothetical protein
MTKRSQSLLEEAPSPSPCECCPDRRALDSFRLHFQIPCPAPRCRIFARSRVASPKKPGVWPLSVVKRFMFSRFAVWSLTTHAFNLQEARIRDDQIRRDAQLLNQRSILSAVRSRYNLITGLGEYFSKPTNYTKILIDNHDCRPAQRLGRITKLCAYFFDIHPLISFQFHNRHSARRARGCQADESGTLSNKNSRSSNRTLFTHALPSRRAESISGYLLVAGDEGLPHVL